MSWKETEHKPGGDYETIVYSSQGWYWCSPMRGFIVVHSFVNLHIFERGINESKKNLPARKIWFRMSIVEISSFSMASTLDLPRVSIRSIHSSLAALVIRTREANKQTSCPVQFCSEEMFKLHFIRRASVVVEKIWSSFACDTIGSAGGDSERAVACTTLVAEFVPFENEPRPDCCHSNLSACICVSREKSSTVIDRQDSLAPTANRFLSSYPRRLRLSIKTIRSAFTAHHLSRLRTDQALQ